MDLVTNYVVITDTIKFVQQFQRRLKATKEEEKEKKLTLYPSDNEKHNKKQKNMIIMTKMLTGMKTRKKRIKQDK
jgi:hypothetical protein